MPKWIKWTIAIFVSLLLIITIIGVAVHEQRPVMTASTEADSVAKKMLAALNVSAWDSVHTVAWQFMGGRRYVWNKRHDSVRVQWSDVTVALHTGSVTGRATRSGIMVGVEESKKYVRKAWKYFCNDSFWLVAPYKVFDPGTERGLVELEDGETGLLVSYTSGGVTPGDSYVWVLNDDFVPNAWKMWVQVIPVGGIEVRWQDWKQHEGGVMLSGSKRIGPLELAITGIEVRY